MNKPQEDNDNFVDIRKEFRKDSEVGLSLNDFYDRSWSGVVWFPMYVFFMQTMVVQYPKTIPDAISKKRYYYYFMNMAEMMPVGDYRKLYMDALDIYPLVPSLDRREDMNRWLHDVCNYVYAGVGQKMRTTSEWIEEYHAYYNPPQVIEETFYIKHRKTVFAIVVLMLLFVISLGVQRNII